MATGKPSLQDFVEKFVGGNYFVRVSEVTVTTSPTRVLQGDMERMAATIINTGAEQISVSPLRTVTATNGVILGEGGGSLALQANEDLVLVGWDWWAVTSAATTTVVTMEVIRFNQGDV